jgi:hypothetical protein
MGLKVNWKKINEIKEDLVNKGFLDDTKLRVMILHYDGDYKKTNIQFKDFLQFMWSLSDSKELDIAGLVITDEEGSILYRHKRITECQEEVPNTGNPYVVKNWNKFSKEQKNTYLTILISQLQSYE